MNYITIPYFYNYTDSHFLPIEWIKINNKYKFFSYHDKLLTIQIEYTKNNCKVFIHNTEYYYIHSCTTSTIRDAIFFIDLTLATIVNHHIMKDKYELATVHNVPLYRLYELAPIEKLSADYDVICY